MIENYDDLNDGNVTNELIKLVEDRKFFKENMDGFRDLLIELLKKNQRDVKVMNLLKEQNLLLCAMIESLDK